MRNRAMEKLLVQVRDGRLAVADALAALTDHGAMAFNSVNIDYQRQARTAVPEVIFAENKEAAQIADIACRMLEEPCVVMATRVDLAKAQAVQERLPVLKYYREARMLVGNQDKILSDQGRGVIAVLAAGTSDVPIAEEAALTAECLGHQVDRAFDVGVAGIHRLMALGDLLTTAAVFVVTAGMEGALPSVVGGLVDKPVLAVPTSVGYGTGLGGVAALMGMLNSCAPGIAVVNIDNGFGAGCMAAAINRRPEAE